MVEAGFWMGVFIAGSAVVAGLGLTGAYITVWDALTYYTTRRIAGYRITKHFVEEWLLKYQQPFNPGLVGRILRNGLYFIDTENVGSAGYWYFANGKQYFAVAVELYPDYRLVTTYPIALGRLLKSARWVFYYW
jgi:hypothetical protein